MTSSIHWPIHRFLLLVGMILFNPIDHRPNCKANVIALSAPTHYPSAVVSNQNALNLIADRRVVIDPFADIYASIESTVSLPDWEEAIQISRPPPTDPSSILAQNMAQADQFQVLYAPTSAYDASWFLIATQDLPLVDPAIHMNHATKLTYRSPDQSFMIWPSQAWTISEEITLSRTIAGLAQIQDALHPATAEVMLDIFHRTGDIRIVTELPHRIVAHHIPYQMQDLADIGFVTQQTSAISGANETPIQLFLGMTSPPDSTVFIIVHTIQETVGKDDLQAGILSNLPPSILDPITLFH